MPFKSPVNNIKITKCCYIWVMNVWRHQSSNQIGLKIRTNLSINSVIHSQLQTYGNMSWAFKTIQKICGKRYFNHSIWWWYTFGLNKNKGNNVTPWCPLQVPLYWYPILLIKSPQFIQGQITELTIHHNAPVPYLTMYHFITEMCSCAHSVTKWCIVGYLSDALWDLWDGPQRLW